MERIRVLCTGVALGFLTACSSGSSSDDIIDNGGGTGGAGDGTAGVPAAIVAFEDDTLGQINAERATDGDGALTSDGALRMVARAHSEDMRDRDFFDHVNPDGDDPFDRMGAAGITFSRAGENIAWNQGYADPVTTAVVGWMNSAGHRANILDGQFTHTGLGIATDGAGRYWFTQVFSRPTGSLTIRSFSISTVSDERGSSWSAVGR